MNRIHNDNIVQVTITICILIFAILLVFAGLIVETDKTEQKKLSKEQRQKIIEQQLEIKSLKESIEILQKCGD